MENMSAILSFLVIMFSFCKIVANCFKFADSFQEENGKEEKTEQVL